MNKQLEKFARDYLKKGIKKCTGSQQRKFRQLYGFGKDGMDIESVIDSVPQEKLDLAMDQLEATLRMNDEKMD